MNYQSLLPVIGIIQNISQTPRDCCNQMITVSTPGGINNFLLSPNTVVVGSTRLRTGMPVAAFYDSSRPVPLIYPPQYQAEIIAPLRNEETVMLNFFRRDLTAADNSLRLNLNRSTEILTLNGQRYSCSPGGNFLLVYYTTTTRSIPPQTTPRRIIVLCSQT
ncbi:MAG: hypothetical protein HFI71_09620 [Lachnospiraceae bacterium]|jgi:hypothetical protein|nr:hypothetical protein [Lachnospiraceae bacterium]